MSEIVRRTTGQVSPAEAARLSKSKLVPEHIANDAASAEYMMRFGAALGIDPMSSFQHIFVFPDGKGRLRAGMSAHLMQALAIAAGHTVSLEGTPVRATATLTRKVSNEELQRFRLMREEERRQKFAQLEDLERLYKMQRGQLKERIEDIQSLMAMEENPSAAEIQSLRKQLAELHGQYNFEDLRSMISKTYFDLTKLIRFESTWTIARASSIDGLMDKSTWKNYAPEMLKNRAKATVVRDGAIDVILGVKNILGDMGLLLSDDPHDELAVASSAYTPEELGAEVNEEGHPIDGEIVDVTQPRASKAQARLVAWAEKIASSADAERIAHWARDLPADEKQGWGIDEKISRIYAVQKAAQEAGKGDQEVDSGDGPLPLKVYLDCIVDLINTTR